MLPYCTFDKLQIADTISGLASIRQQWKKSLHNSTWSMKEEEGESVGVSEGRTRTQEGQVNEF